MSNQHWKKTVQVKPELESHLQALINYAKEKNKTITVFDLEATTFLGRKNFGITEIGMVHVTPSGKIGVSGSLVNPEQSIPKEVEILTGISNDMVKNLKSWKDLWAEAIEHICNTHIVVGFNSSSFDIKALIQEHKKCFNKELIVQDHLDIRLIYNKLVGTSKGKLAEIAEQLDIDVS